MSKKRNYINRSVTILFALALATTCLAGCGLGESWEIHTKENSKLQSNNILDVEVDGNNGKWVTTKREVDKMGAGRSYTDTEYDLFGYSDGEWESYEDSEKVQSAIGGFGSDDHLIDASSKGGLWLCGSNGLMKIKGGKVRTFEESKVPLNENGCEVISESSGVVWVYSYPHLIKYGGTEWNKHKLNHKWEEGSGDVLLMDVGTNGNLFVYAGESSNLKNNIKNIKRGGVIYKYDGESMTNIASTDTKVVDLHIDSENGIWVTTEGESRRVREELTLKKYGIDKEGGSWTTYYTHRGISEVTTESPAVAWANVTYFKMQDSRYRVGRIGSSSKTVYVHKSSPLPSDAKDIEVAPDGSIWFATRKGLAQLSYWW